MAENMLAQANRVEPLTDVNYYVWALKVGAILRNRKLYKEVIESEEPATDAGTIRETWENRNNEAFGIIILTLSNEQAGQFIGETNARTVWKQLETRYAGNIEDRKIDIGLELKDIKMETNDTVKAYVTRARNIASRSASLGKVISTREIVYHVVRGISSKLEKVGSVLRAQKGLTLEEIEQILTEEEMRLSKKDGNAKQNTGHDGKDERAYKTAGYRKKNNSKGCYICGKTNHLAKNCYYRQDNHPEGRNQKGKYAGGGRGDGSRKQIANAAIKDKNEYTYCTYGHDRKEGEKYTWTLDSGATSHMTPNQEIIEDIQPYHTKIHLAEEKRSIETEAKGNVKVTTLTKKGNKNICIKDVLYVLSLRGNLLSVSQLLNSGNKVIFSDNRARILTWKNVLIGEAVEQDGMYILRTVPRNEHCRNVTGKVRIQSTKEASVEETQYDRKDKLLWHKRLGHICEEYLDTMQRRDTVRDLDFAKEKLRICDTCVMGKISQHPHKMVDERVSKAPMELVHIDVCGPLPTKSLGGNRYILVIVDDYSRYTCVYFMENKTEVFKHFVEYVRRYENEHDRKLKKVRSDNGTEFVNEKFECFLKRKGISHQRTVAYNPQSNGVVERTNRILLDKARTLLIDSKLPMSFWGEAVATAAYLKNITLTKGGNNRTPLEMWTGRKPTVSYLKVFGCVAYYYIPKAYRNKLQPRAKKGIFIGYSQETRGYRVYDPEDRKIHAVKTAKFNENLKGSELLGSKYRNMDNDIDLLYRTERKENESDEEDATNNEEETDDTKDTEEIEEMDEEREQIPQRREDIAKRRGRKPGITNEDTENVRKIELQIREEKLREQGVRRSERIESKRQQANTARQVSIPTNFTQATNSTEAEDWRKAMRREMNAMDRHEVWKIVPRSKDMKITKSKWVYNLKDTSDNNIEKYKARLVAVGSSLQEGRDYAESSSPVIKMESFRALMAIASVKRMCIKQYDVRTAYLYASLDKPVYMEQPEGFIVRNKEDYVCKLEKSIYGLPQSGRHWNEEFDRTLKEIGLKNVPEDPCVYKYAKGKRIVIVGIYVDDCIVIGTDETIVNELISRLRWKFDIEEIQGGLKFLNIKIEGTSDGIYLSQEDYIDKILKKFELEDWNPSRTPAAYQQNLDEYKESPEVDKTYYQELIGSIMYLAVGTRPDISFTVSHLSQYCKDPRKIHLDAIKRVYRYLKGTRGYILKFDRQQLEVQASTDASWNSTADAKSYSGYIVKMGNNSVCWKSRKQSLVAMSTCEAELIAICEGTREIIWLQNLLRSLDVVEEGGDPITVYTDSKAAIDWIHKSGITNRTKHVNRTYYFIREEVKNKRLELKHVHTERMMADILTKGLPAEKHLLCTNSFQLQAV